MNINKWFAMLVVMLALTGMVIAETDDTDTGATLKQALIVRYDHLICKVNFTTTQIDSLNKYVPTANVSSYKEKLSNDMNTLKVFVDSNNKTGFDEYVASTFRQDFNAATDVLNDVKKNFRKYNVSNDSKTAFINELKTSRDVYSDCISDKELKMGQVLQKHIDNWNKNWDKVIERLSQKGINVTEMEALKTELALKNAELQAIVASGNVSELRKYMNDYRQDQLLYAAQFEIAKLKTYKEKLNPMAKKYNLSGKIDDINSKIGEANKYAQKGYKYKEGEFQNVWDHIKNASKDMKEISKDVLKEQSREKQEQKEDKKAGKINSSKGE
jgi:hypothetical protein